MSTTEIIFDSPSATQINKARLDHLESLGLPLPGKTVLEVGAGIGKLTSFFETQGCRIVSTDARPDNVHINRLRHPKRTVYIADLNIPGSHDDLGGFDIVFCYGTLYHLENPALAIANLAPFCKDLFLLETCVHHADNNEINPVNELTTAHDQSFHGKGCRPARNWFMHELKKYFPFVYVSSTQPDHDEYPLVWPNDSASGRLSRAVFVGSRTSLSLPTLQETLPSVQVRYHKEENGGAESAGALANAPAGGTEHEAKKEPAISLPSGQSMLRSLTSLCDQYKESLPKLDFEIMQEFDLLHGHPWETLAASPHTNYYACLYILSKALKPKNILEIGTAFGMSGAALVRSGVNLSHFVSIDLGIFSEQHNFPINNIMFARQKLHAWCMKNAIETDRVQFFQANTQPEGKTDNTNVSCSVPYWSSIPELKALVDAVRFDVLFIDGKHTDQGLFNDMVTFWKYLRPGGLLICDDLHDPAIYKKHFAWAGDTLYSFNSAIKALTDEIAEYALWNFPYIGTSDLTGLRPFGLILKR